MNDIENYMVTAGAKEWEQMYAPTPSDKAGPEEYDRFAWETGAIAEVLSEAFGLEDGEITEDIAQRIYTSLPHDYVMGIVRDWSQSSEVRERYDRHMEERK